MYIYLFTFYEHKNNCASILSSVYGSFMPFCGVCVVECLCGNSGLKT